MIHLLASSYELPDVARYALLERRGGDIAARAAAVCGQHFSKRAMLAYLDDREELGSTGIGAGVAVPHARHDSIGDLVGAFARSKKGISFDDAFRDGLSGAALTLSGSGTP